MRHRSLRVWLAAAAAAAAVVAAATVVTIAAVRARASRGEGAQMLP
jgi:hypothetical protein